MIMNSLLDPILTERNVAEYTNDGVTCLRAVLSPAEIEAAQDAVDRNLREPAPWTVDYETREKKGRFFMGMFIWKTDPTLRELVLHSRLPRMACGLLQAEKVNLFYDQLFVKEPGTANPTPWHNDLPYWPIKGTQVISFWIALDEVTRESGAVEYIRGSHRWERWFQPRTFSGPNNYEINPEYEPMPDIDAARASYDIVSYDMAPGDVIAFHGMTVHGSGGNASANRRRRGYSLRYTGDDVVYAPRRGTFQWTVYNPGLEPGAPLDCELFPVVYRREEAGKAKAGAEIIATPL